jgi:DNA-directed RNA polymerase specialized sigma24 family protein
MQRELEALRAGRLTFDGFVRATRLEWFRLAAYLLRRWSAPADVGLEDLVQEMLLGAWDVVGRFDPRRGKSVQQFVVWNAVTRAKKWLHKQRCAYKLDDRSPSRHALCMAALDEDAGRRLEPVAVELPADAVDRTRALAEAVGRLESDVDRALLLCLVDARGDVERAARDVVARPRARWLLRIEDETHARRAIRRAMARAAS